MAPHGFRSVHLTTRDLAVLEWLVVRRAACVDELHREHFDAASRKRAVNRLSELVAGGFLHRVRLEVPDELGGAVREQSIYTLGPKARAALEIRSLSSEHFRFRPFNPTLRDSSIPHQLVVNRVCDLLQVDAIPEHLLPVAADKDAMRHKPDAAWERNVNESEPWKNKVLLEVDLGHYSRERVLGKLRSFVNRPDGLSMVIVVPTTRRQEEVKSWVNAEKRQHPYGHYPCHIHTIDELVADPERFRGYFGHHLHNWSTRAA